MQRLVGLLSVAASVGVVLAQSPPDPTESALWHTAAVARGVPAVLGDRVFGTTVSHDVVALSLVDGKEVWRRSTGEIGTTTEGTRVVATPDAVIVGDWDIYAYRPGSGEAAWQFHPTNGYGPGVFLGDAVGGRVFSGSPSGSVYALETATGQLDWMAPVETDGRTSVFAPVSDGRIVVAVYTIFTSPNAGGVVGLDAATGKERWRLRFPASDDPSIAVNAGGGPVFAGGTVFVSSGDGIVWAVNVDDGTVQWRVPRLQGPVTGIITDTRRDMRSLAVAGGRLLVGSLTGYVVAYDLETRREAWRFEGGWLGSTALDDFTPGDGVVYVSYMSGFLLALDTASGAVLWQTGDYLLGLSWPPVLSGDRIVAAGRSGFWAFRLRPEPPR